MGVFAKEVILVLDLKESVEAHGGFQQFKAAVQQGVRDDTGSVACSLILEVQVTVKELRGGPPGGERRGEQGVTLWLLPRGR